MVNIYKYNEAALCANKHVLPLRGSSSKLEEACDLFVRAANMYKMAKNWCGKNTFFYSLHKEIRSFFF